MRLLLAISLILGVACNHSKSIYSKTTTVEGMKSFVAEKATSSGITAKKEFGDIQFSVNIMPASVRATRETGMKAVGTPSWKKALQEAQKLETYQIKIAHKDGLDLLNTESVRYRNYEDRIKYFSYDIQSRIKMKIGTEVYPCIISHFERSYGNMPFLLINIAFDATKIKLKNQDRIISIDDAYFNIGKINLLVNKEDILSEPQIN